MPDEEHDQECRIKWGDKLTRDMSIDELEAMAFEILSGRKPSKKV